MLPAVFIALFIVVSNYLGLHFGEQEVVGLTFRFDFVLIAPMLFLRDILHEQGQRMLGFLFALSAFIISYLVFDDKAWIIAGAFAVTWTLLIDGHLYTWFRRFGWGPGMVVSDLLCLPIMPLFHYWLYTGGFHQPTGQVALMYLTMLIWYGIILKTNMLDRFMRIPRNIRVPRENWFKFYDHV